MQGRESQECGYTKTNAGVSMAKSGSCWEAYLQIKRAEYTPDQLSEYSFLNKVGFF